MAKHKNRDPDTLLLPIRILFNLLGGVFLLGFLFNTLVLINGYLKKYDFATAFGVSPVVVTPSREGTPEDMVHSGDLLFAIEQKAEKYEVGDSVAYWVNGRLLIGKISYIEGDRSDPDLFVRAAFSEQSYATPATQETLLGEIRIQIPYLGYLVLFLTTLAGRLIFVGIPFLIYFILLIVEMHREREEAGDDEFQTPVPIPTGRPRRVRVSAEAAKQMARYAPWAFIATAVITVAAIRYGTADSRYTEKKIKRIADGFKADLPNNPFLISQDLPRSRTKRLRPVRAVRALIPQASRPVTRICSQGASRGKR